MICLETLTRDGLANLFDHTLLRADARREEFERLCRESRENGFKMVAINSAPVALCKQLLAGSPVHVGAAISFPLGQTTSGVKLAETAQAIDCGADEIDYVVNISDVKDGRWNAVQREMDELTALCHGHKVLIKVIFETCYLSPEEIVQLAKIARMVEPDFIKTSTGFGSGGARAEDVLRMKEAVGTSVKIKASGGIRCWADCRAMLMAGAERIGTSSSLAILAEFSAERGDFYAI